MRCQGMRIGLRNKSGYPASESDENEGREIPAIPHSWLVQGECKQKPENGPG
jgi:hypothetical protein